MENNSATLLAAEMLVLKLKYLQGKMKLLSKYFGSDSWFPHN